MTRSGHERIDVAPGGDGRAVSPTRRLLLAAYHFPPMGGSGVQRPAKFAQHLPRLGWAPVVLCAGHARYPVCDSTLCDAVPASVHVERFSGAEPAGLVEYVDRALTWRRAAHGRESCWGQRLYWMLHRAAQGLGVPEMEWLWATSARRRARTLARRFGVEAVLTSGPPFSTHLLGLHLQRRLGLPWIAEFRDPLTTNYTYAPRTTREDRFWQRLESDVIRRADHVVVTCDDLARDFQTRYPELAGARISTITNGWDADDGWHAVPPPREAGVCVLRYVGAFYRQQSIGPMLEAMRLWLEREPAWVGRARFEVVGTLSAEQQRLVRPGDERFFTHRGYATHADAVEAMRGASALYLTAADAPGGQFYIPAKTFEYLASDRPILATIPRGTSLEHILTQAGGTRIAANHQPQTLAAELAEFCPAVLAGRWDGLRDRGALNAFRRDALARRMAEVLDAVVAGRPVLHLAGDAAQEQAA